MDCDISWKDPTEAQLAAWELACDTLGVSKASREYMRSKHHLMVVLEATGRAAAVDAEIYTGPAHAMTPYTLAEMICMAGSSLWYIQAKAWAGGEVPKGLEKFKTVFQIAGEVTKKIVDWGYQDGKWWDVKAIWPESEWPGMALQLVSILEAVRLVDAINRPADLRDLIARIQNNDTGYILSAGWRWFPKCIMPGVKLTNIRRLLAQRDEDCIRVAVGEIRAYFEPAFRKSWNAAKREVREQMYEAAKCIKPDCENMVAPAKLNPREGDHKNYRGLGSCCRGHASYYCNKCYAPHSYSSKIGTKHLKYFGRDWDGKNPDGTTYSQLWKENQNEK